VSIRFGLVGFPLGQHGVTVDAPAAETVTRIARAADDAGFDFVCAQDHTLAPREWVGERATGTIWHDPWVVLSWAAAVTTRIRLVTDVVILPYRSPFAVAKAAASLDQLSGGRVTLGVAAGYLEREFEILGAEFARRGDVTDEHIEAIKVAWTNEWFDFDGEFTTAKEVAVAPRPTQEPRPPIWVGGNSLRALRRAVEHADGWTPFRGEPDTITAALRKARDEWGLDRPLAVSVPIRRGMFTADDSALDLDSIRRQVEALAGAGVTHLKVGFKGPDLGRYLVTLERFGETIVQEFAGS
jgi:probable F420-dependent oxidoreductase